MDALPPAGRPLPHMDEHPQLGRKFTVETKSIVKVLPHGFLERVLYFFLNLVGLGPKQTIQQTHFITLPQNQETVTLTIAGKQFIVSRNVLEEGISHEAMLVSSSSENIQRDVGENLLDTITFTTSPQLVSDTDVSDRRIPPAPSRASTTYQETVVHYLVTPDDLQRVIFGTSSQLVLEDIVDNRDAPRQIHSDDPQFDFVVGMEFIKAGLNREEDQDTIADHLALLKQADRKLSTSNDALPSLIHVKTKYYGTEKEFVVGRDYFEPGHIPYRYIAMVEDGNITHHIEYVEMNPSTAETPEEYAAIVYRMLPRKGSYISRMIPEEELALTSVSVDIKQIARDFRGGTVVRLNGEEFKLPPHPVEFAKMDNSARSEYNTKVSEREAQRLVAAIERAYPDPAVRARVLTYVLKGQKLPLYWDHHESSMFTNYGVLASDDTPISLRSDQSKPLEISIDSENELITVALHRFIPVDPPIKVKEELVFNYMEGPGFFSVVRE